MISDWILLGLRIAAPLLLYLFLGIILHQMLAGYRAPQPPSDFLRRLDQLDTKLPLGVEVSLGRDDDNTFTFDSEFISAYHATITCQDGTWWVIDLDSTNGTLLNEIPVQVPTPLDYGDVISLGDIQLRLERGT